MEQQLQIKKLDYEKIKVYLYENKSIDELYVKSCEFIIKNNKDELFGFITRNHNVLETIVFEKYNNIFYIVKIKSIQQLKDIISIFKEPKIIATNTKFNKLKAENENELFNSEVFKILNTYDILINVKYHDNFLFEIVDIDEIINKLFTLNAIIEHKKINKA